jgi:DNA-binding winged helix-turn-helix (wHTH) protein/tetratricopeptide (TPR) repeat protein
MMPVLLQTPEASMLDPQPAASRVVRFGDVEADLHAGEIRRPGARVVLPDQALRVLRCLLERPGDVVTREELRHELWADNTFVDFEHGLNSAVRRLREALGDSADAPRFIETLPRRGYRFIAAIDASAIADAPSGNTPAKGSRTATLPSRRTVTYVVLASAVALVAGWLVFASSRSVPEATRDAPAPRSPLDRPNLVVVAAFENQTGDAGLAHLGRLTADRIISAIGRVENAAVVSEPIATPLSGDQSSWAGTDGPEGAELMVTGAYYLRGTRLEFHARILDASTAKALYFGTPASGPSDDPTAALQQLEQSLGGAVAIHFDYGFGGLNLTSAPPLLDAYLEYRAGAELFDRDYPRAIGHLQRALTISPDFFLGRILLVMAYDNLADRENTMAQMAQIANRADRLTTAERLLFEYLRESLARRPADAIRALQHLEQLAPHSWLVNYSLQMEALVLNRPRLAVEAFDRLPLHERYLRWNAWRLAALARALHHLGQHERELEAARRAKAYEPGKMYYVAIETAALAGLGRVEEIHRVIDETMSVAPRHGTHGEVMQSAAEELRVHGHRAASLQVAGRAIVWFRARPESVASTEAHRAALARALYLAERWDEAKTAFEGLAAEQPSSVEYAGYLGAIAARQRRSNEARQASDTLHNRASRELFGRHTYWRARIAALLGEHQRAVELLREAVGQGLHLGQQIHRTPDFDQLADFGPFAELVAPRN